MQGIGKSVRLFIKNAADLSNKRPVPVPVFPANPEPASAFLLADLSGEPLIRRHSAKLPRMLSRSDRRAVFAIAPPVIHTQAERNRRLIALLDAAD